MTMESSGDENRKVCMSTYVSPLLLEDFFQRSKFRFQGGDGVGYPSVFCCTNLLLVRVARGELGLSAVVSADSDIRGVGGQALLHLRVHDRTLSAKTLETLLYTPNCQCGVLFGFF